jgi:hypothetical protein
MSKRHIVVSRKHAKSRPHAHRALVGDYPPLRQVLERMIQIKPREEAIAAGLLRILEREALISWWGDYFGRPVRFWSTNGDTSLMEIVNEIRSRIPRSSKHTPAMNFDSAGLELFIKGKTVFTTDADWSLAVRFFLPEYCIALRGTPPVLPGDGVLSHERSEDRPKPAGEE